MNPRDSPTPGKTPIVSLPSRVNAVALAHPCHPCFIDPPKSKATQAMATSPLPSFERPFLPIIRNAFTRYAEDEFLHFQGRGYSYAETARLSGQIAARLHEGGFQPGMKGAVYSTNSAISFIATLGILLAGGTWIPVNPRNAPKENVGILRKFSVEALFFEAAFGDPAGEFLKTSNGCTVACLDGNEGPHPELFHWIGDATGKPPEINPAPADLISIPLTGGTTGLPKGVMLSNRNFCAIEYATRHMYEGRRPVILCAAPMTHVSGRIALAGMSSGARCIILPKVDSQLILNAIEAHGVTDFFLPPTGIYTLLDQPNVNDFDFSTVRTISYGSAPMSTARLKQALETMGPVMRGGYGQTESPMFIARLHPHEHYVNNDIAAPIADDQRLKSVGRHTVISTIGIVDDDQNELPSGATGEIAVKGPMVSEGYYLSPEETARVRKKGWHLTGDIGYLDNEGYLYIVDRKKDMIISGGFNVYSTEVERALLDIEDVLLAAVIGVPDDKWGEAVAAFVQLVPQSDLDAQAILNQARESLGGVKAPKQVTIVDDLPRTPVGKIDKKPLREASWAGMGRKI